MPDHMDGVQEHAQQQQDKALADTLDRIERSKVGGLGACVECGDAISDFRKSLGAQHCLDCLRDIEAVHAKARRRTCL